MKFFIVWISAFVLAPILGTCLAILVTLFKTNNLKLKISILTFLFPVLYGLLLRLMVPSIFGDLFWLSIFILAILIRDSIFTTRKYLATLSIVNGQFIIEYITPYLTKNISTLSLSDVTNLKLSRMDALIDYPASLKLAINSDDIRQFSILSKNIWNLVSNTFNAANMGLGVMSADGTHDPTSPIQQLRSRRKDRTKL